MRTRSIATVAILAFFVPQGVMPGWGSSSAMAQQERYESLAGIRLTEDRPTAETAQLLKDELRFRRASQVYLWALPVINLYGRNAA
jgi:hypothetical protein